MYKDKENVYFVVEMDDSPLTKQLEWSKRALKSDKEINQVNIALYQGQLINFIHYDMNKNKFVKGLAICLEDTDEYSNEAVICPLIDAASFREYKLGINVGKIIGFASDYDQIALIPTIHSISKDYILTNKGLESNIFPQSTINNIINSYRRFLKSLIIKHSKKSVGNIS